MHVEAPTGIEGITSLKTPNMVYEVLLFQFIKTLTKSPSIHVETPTCIEGPPSFRALHVVCSPSKSSFFKSHSVFIYKDLQEAVLHSY